MNDVNASRSAQEALRVLGVDAAYDAADLRRAFLSRVKAVHPDRPGGDAAALRAAIEAYRRLQPRMSAALPRSLPPRPAYLTISPAQAMVGGTCRFSPTGGKALDISLPAGLRSGDRVRVGDRLLRVTVRSDETAAVLGDHLCLTIEVAAGLLRRGGRVVVTTPAGPVCVWVSAGDGARGLVRAVGEGLPARGKRPRGDLFVRLKAAEIAEEDPAVAKRRRFAANWAA
jgi:curved DNA-binding protein